MIRTLVGLCSGLLFAAGLSLAGMTRPSKIIAFLDVAGGWDPSLLLVLLTAIAVYATAYWASRRMQRPFAHDAFSEVPSGRVDTRLVVGATLFGIGWGVSGYCPGPAMTSLGAGVWSAALFVPAMLAGIWLTRRFERPAR